MPSVTINGIEYGIYKSRFITGQRHVLRQTAEFCLKDEMVLDFWRRAVRAIWDSPRYVEDDEVFTSEDMDVFLGPWYIDIRHRIESFYERRYDVDFGEYETVHLRDDESFEVIGAYDVDNDENLPGIVSLLNAFYKSHKREILKTF